MRRNESSHDGLEGAGASQCQTKTLFPITSSVSTALLLCNAVALLLTREAGVGIQCLATTVRSTAQCFSTSGFRPVWLWPLWALSRVAEAVKVVKAPCSFFMQGTSLSETISPLREWFCGLAKHFKIVQKIISIAQCYITVVVTKT